MTSTAQPPVAGQPHPPEKRLNGASGLSDQHVAGLQTTYLQHVPAPRPGSAGPQPDPTALELRELRQEMARLRSDYARLRELLSSVAGKGEAGTANPGGSPPTEAIAVVDRTPDAAATRPELRPSPRRTPAPGADQTTAPVTHRSTPRAPAPHTPVTRAPAPRPHPAPPADRGSAAQPAPDLDTGADQRHPGLPHRPHDRAADHPQPGPDRRASSRSPDGTAAAHTPASGHPYPGPEPPRGAGARATPRRPPDDPAAPGAGGSTGGTVAHPRRGGRGWPAHRAAHRSGHRAGRGAGRGAQGRHGRGRPPLLRRPRRRLHADGAVLRPAAQAARAAHRVHQGRLPAPHDHRTGRRLRRRRHDPRPDRHRRRPGGHRDGCRAGSAEPDRRTDVPQQAAVLPLRAAAAAVDARLPAAR